MRERDDIDRELARIGEATQHIVPRGDFTSRVMLAVLEEARPLFSFLVARAAHRLLPIAALAAAMAILWAFHAESSLDEVLAISYDLTDLEW